MKFHITPMTRLQIRVLVDDEEPDDIRLGTLIYDMFSVGNDSFDLNFLISTLARQGECQVTHLPGYGRCVVKVI
jgi:hypothetical protein